MGEDLRRLEAGIKAAEDRLEYRRIVGEVNNNLEFAWPQEQSVS